MKRAALILAALLCMASRHPDRMIRSDLALNVSFNRGDASDRSMYAATPTLNGNAVVTAGQRYLTLDGNDHASYPDADAHSFTVGGQDQPFSAGGWVYLNSNTTSNKAIMFKATGSPLAVEWAIKAANGATNDPTFIVYNSGATQFVGRRTNAALSTGQWHHVFGTYSGSEATTGLKVYVNGVQADTAFLNSGSYTGMSNTAALLRIGGVDTGEYINGLVDDCRVYNRELSAAEVAAIYSSGRE